MKKDSLLGGSAVMALMILAPGLTARAQQSGPLPAVPPAQTAAPADAKPNAPTQNATATPSAAKDSAATSSAAGATVKVPSGTRIPLVLHNAISTKSARPGDPVYFETLFPVMEDGRVVIPAGTYVSGEVTESKRAGRVKGRAELMIRPASE